MGERSLDKSKLGLDCSGYPTLIFRTLTTITSQSSALTLTWSFFGFFSQFYSTPQNYNIMTMWLVTCNAEFTPTFIMMIQGHHNMRILDTHQVSISTLPIRVYVSTSHQQNLAFVFLYVVLLLLKTQLAEKWQALSHAWSPSAIQLCCWPAWEQEQLDSCWVKTVLWLLRQRRSFTLPGKTGQH